MKKWCENNFYYLLMIFLVIVGWTITLTSMAIGQETLDAVIKDGKIIVYKTTRIQTEIIPLPDKELGISDEDAKKVCLSAEKKITVTKEIDKKLNFFSFPFVKTKTVVEKEISNDAQNGWQSRIVNQEKLSERSWLMTITNVILFTSFVFLSQFAFRNKKIIKLFKFYILILFICALFAIYFAGSVAWIIVTSLLLGIICIISATETIVNIILQDNWCSIDLLFTTYLGGGILLVSFVTFTMAITTHNSIPEFMIALLFMITVSLIIGWFSSFIKKERELSPKKKGLTTTRE